MQMWAVLSKKEAIATYLQLEEAKNMYNLLGHERVVLGKVELSSEVDVLQMQSLRMQKDVISLDAKAHMNRKY